MWDALVITPFTNILLLIYGLLGHDFAIAITVFTVLVRVVTYPLTIQQQKSAKAMQDLQPKIKELQKKYAKDQQRLQQEQWKLMQEAGVNPFGGCLPLLLQFPIFIGLYQVILYVLALSPMQMVELARHLQGPLSQWVSSVLNTSLSSLIPLNHRFLWLDLGQPDPFFILPIVVGVTTYLQQKVMTPPSTDPQAQSMNRMMMWYMPIFLGWIVTTVPSGLGLYWLISNVIGIAQYWLVGRPQPAAATAQPSARPVNPPPAAPVIAPSAESAEEPHEKPAISPPSAPVPHLPVKKRKRKR